MPELVSLFFYFLKLKPPLGMTLYGFRYRLFTTFISIEGIGSQITEYPIYCILNDPAFPTGRFFRDIKRLFDKRLE